MIEYLGRGVYGVVAKALNFNGGNTVAIKTSSCIDITFHESEILKLLSPSPYVVQILGEGKAEIEEGGLMKEIRTKDDSLGRRLNKVVYIAMELMDMDLLSFIKKIIHGGYSYNHWFLSINNGPALGKWLMWELCNGIAYCHDMGVAHRDLKPSNCLVSVSKEGTIKIKLADFGLAAIVKDKKNGQMEMNGIEYVSLWYRAPELLMKLKTYNCFAIDIWALGCIFAEIVTGEPLFCGQCPEEQLNIVFQHVGGSSLEMIDKYCAALVDAKYASTLAQLLTRPSSSGLQNRFQSTPEKMGNSVYMDFLVKMLEVDPNKRLTAKQCLQHPYFSSFHHLKYGSETPT